LKGRGIDGREEISRAARNHLARAAETQGSETQRPAAFVANGLTITAAGDHLC
jgi:hypothetical protein